LLIMLDFTIIMAGLTAVILFIFGLDHFSQEIQKISGDRFRRFLGRATRVPAIGVLIGALVTAVIQSSSATSVIAISLVNAGVLSFKNSVGIIFGSNIGTTVTAQLVAFKLTAFAPILVIGGFLLSLFPSRFAIFGKSIFYFGFVFFSLNLISSSLAPLQHNADFVAYLTEAQNPLIAIAIGGLFTAMVQSSSVTTGLAIVFVQQGLLSLENAVPLVMGANLGTTSTALLAIFNMDISAKKAALSHFLFNLGGVLLFLPPLLLFGDRLNQLDMSPAMELAMIHLVFNVGTSLAFLAFINPFTRFVDRVLGEGKMDFQRITLPRHQDDMSFEEIEGQLLRARTELYAFLQENYNLVTLSIESNYRSMYEAAAKRIEYLNFIEREFQNHFSEIIAAPRSDDEARDLLRLISEYDYLFQIHDSIEDLFSARRVLQERYIEIKSDILVLIREISSNTLALFDAIGRVLDGQQEVDIRPEAVNLQRLLNRASQVMLALARDSDRRDAGALGNFVTYSRRLKDKLVNLTAIDMERRALTDFATTPAEPAGGPPKGLGPK